MPREKKAFVLSFKTLSFLTLSPLSVVGLLACGSISPKQPLTAQSSFSSKPKTLLGIRATKSSQLAIEGLADKTLITKLNASQRLNSLSFAKSQTSWTLQSLAESVSQIEQEVEPSKIEPLLESEVTFKNFNSGLIKLQSLVEELLLTQAQLKQVKTLQKELDLIREKFIKAKGLLNQILSLQARLAKAQRLLGLARLNLANAYEHNWSLRKELLLYFFTFKWLWGVFSGYSPSTSYSQETYQVESLEQEVANLSESLLPQIADLSKRLRLELAALKSSRYWLRNLALSFSDSFRIDWGLRQISELFEQVLAAEEAYEASRQSFDELVASRILARQEVVKYLDNWVWSFDSEFDLSTHWESATVGETEFVVSAFQNEKGSSEPHKDTSEGTNITKPTGPPQPTNPSSSVSGRKHGELCFSGQSTPYKMPQFSSSSSSSSWTYTGPTLLQGCTSTDTKNSSKLKYPISIGGLVCEDISDGVLCSG